MEEKYLYIKTDHQLISLLLYETVCDLDISPWKAEREARNLGDMSVSRIEVTIYVRIGCVSFLTMNEVRYL